MRLLEVANPLLCDIKFGVAAFSNDTATVVATLKTKYRQVVKLDSLIGDAQ